MIPHVAAARLRLDIAGERIGPSALARELNEAAVSARKGGEWHPKQIERLLKIDQTQGRANLTVEKMEQRILRHAPRLTDADDARIRRLYEKAMARHAEAAEDARKIAVALRGEKNI